jgi:hypothetical protein
MTILNKNDMSLCINATFPTMDSPGPTLHFCLLYLLHLAEAYKVMTHGLLRQAMYRLVCHKQADCEEGIRLYNNLAAPAVCPFSLDFATRHGRDVSQTRDMVRRTTMSR